MNEVFIKGASEIGTTIRYNLGKSLGETLDFLYKLIESKAVKEANLIIDLEDYPHAVFKLTAERRKHKRDKKQ